MRMEKQKKSICFLLLICMLFLGMCFENVQADSFFLTKTTAQATSTIRSAGHSTLTNLVYHEEAIAKQDCATDINQVVRRCLNRTLRGTALNLIFVDILPQISPIILTSADCELTEESSSCTVIVNYIHHKDGKKA